MKNIAKAFGFFPISENELRGKVIYGHVFGYSLDIWDDGSWVHYHNEIVNRNYVKSVSNSGKGEESLTLFLENFKAYSEYVSYFLSQNVGIPMSYEHWNQAALSS